MLVNSLIKWIRKKKKNLNQESFLHVIVFAKIWIMKYLKIPTSNSKHKFGTFTFRRVVLSWNLKDESKNPLEVLHSTFT